MAGSGGDCVGRCGHSSLISWISPCGPYARSDDGECVSKFGS
jgi:hypothetical protein